MLSCSAKAFLRDFGVWGPVLFKVKANVEFGIVEQVHPFETVRGQLKRQDFQPWVSHCQDGELDVGLKRLLACMRTTLRSPEVVHRPLVVVQPEPVVALWSVGPGMISIRVKGSAVIADSP